MEKVVVTRNDLLKWAKTQIEEDKELGSDDFIKPDFFYKLFIKLFPKLVKNFRRKSNITWCDMNRIIKLTNLPENIINTEAIQRIPHCKYSYSSQYHAIFSALAVLYFLQALKEETDVTIVFSWQLSKTIQNFLKCEDAIKCTLHMTTYEN